MIWIPILSLFRDVVFHEKRLPFKDVRHILNTDTTITPSPFSQDDLSLGPIAYIPPPPPTYEQPQSTTIPNPPTWEGHQDSKNAIISCWLSCSLQLEYTPLEPPTTPHHLSNVVSCSSLSSTHQAFSVGITTDFEPRFYLILLNTSAGEMPWIQRSKHDKIITHGTKHLCYQIKRPLVVSGLFVVNTTLMVP